VPVTNISPYTKQFKIEIVHSPTGKSIEFGLFLTSFNDSFKPNFKTQNVYGRMDPIVNFQNTSRTITVAFVVPAASEAESQKNLEALSSLASFQYPKYLNLNVVSGITSPPICKMKMHNLITENGDFLHGYFSGFDFSPVNESGYFIADNNYLFPKEYKVNLTFNVLHTKAIGWSGNVWQNRQGPLLGGAFPPKPAQGVAGAADAVAKVASPIAAASQGKMAG
jgi:hypothetical protein